MRETTDMLVCEDFFPDKKDVLLSIKIQRDLYEALKRKSGENDDLEFPDFIRSALAFHVLPDVLQEMAVEGPLDQEGKNSLQQLQEYCESILQACRGVETIKKRARELKMLSSEMEALVESKTTEAVNRSLAEMKSEFEANEQRRQEQRKQKRAAGLLEPGPPLELTEDQKANLTESQRKQRRSLGWDR